MRRGIHLVCVVALLGLGALTVRGAWAASVSGHVRDSVGVPQMGAQIQLLRTDMSVAATAITDSQGSYMFVSVLPGRYSIKAIAEAFLPSLRENVRVRAGTVVNLTLNTLYEAIQWLPAKSRANATQNDDWAWTLRSAANRPLLRWLEDGPLVVVSDGPGTQPRLKARLMATGQAGTFGESGERYSAVVEDTPSDSRELLARVDFDPGTDAEMESMLGFRQDLGLAGSVQSVAAVAVRPEVENGSTQGMDEVAMRSWETMRMGEALQAEVGTTEAMARMGGAASGALIAALPFANVEWRSGDMAVTYRMATMISDHRGLSDTEASAWMPAIAERNGELVAARGLHQEIGWQRRTSHSGISFVVYADSIENSLLEAIGNTGGEFAGAALVDPASGLLRTAGPGYSSTGVQAGFEHSLPGNNRAWLSYASGSALAMPASPQPGGSAEQIAAAYPRHAQAFTITLSGTLEGTKTHWQASYRWQPEDTVTEVAPYAADGSTPYWGLRLRQPLRADRDGSVGIDALFNTENLLAQGYRPYRLPDGSLLLFTQDPRSFSTGLAFTF